MAGDNRRWVVLIREDAHWRVLASYPNRPEAYRSCCAQRADGLPVRLLREGDPRIEKMLCGR